MASPLILVCLLVVAVLTPRYIPPYAIISLNNIYM